MRRARSTGNEGIRRVTPRVMRGYWLAIFCLSSGANSSCGGSLTPRQPEIQRDFSSDKVTQGHRGRLDQHQEGRRASVSRLLSDGYRHQRRRRDHEGVDQAVVGRVSGDEDTATGKLANFGPKLETRVEVSPYCIIVNPGDKTLWGATDEMAVLGQISASTAAVIHR